MIFLHLFSLPEPSTPEKIRFLELRPKNRDDKVLTAMARVWLPILRAGRPGWVEKDKKSFEKSSLRKGGGVWDNFRFLSFFMFSFYTFFLFGLF